MSPTVAFIHTSPSMVPVFKPLANELLPAGTQTFNMVDESLLCDIVRDGRCPPQTARRLANHVLSAADAGATHVLVTCSSMGAAVEAARSLCPATVLRVDEPMAERAVATGNRVGVIATLPSTLAPTVALVQAKAAATGREIVVTPRLVEGAFAAVMSGDGATHDQLVGDAVRQLGREVDVILLAQASMARVADALPPNDRPVPILASPRLAVERLAQLLGGRAA